jgi:hypothetical protein
MEVPEYDGKMDLKLYLKKINNLLFKNKKSNYYNVIKFLNILFDMDFKYLRQFKFIPLYRLTTDKDKIISALDLFPELKNEFGKKNLLSIIRLVLKKNGFRLTTTTIDSVITLFVR